MYTRNFEPALMNDAIEREMIIRELRAQASAELSRAIGRFCVKLLSKVRSVFTEANQLRSIVPAHLRQMT